MEILGIYRSKKHSPNHVDNDAAIMYLVHQHLVEAECDVQLVEEKDFLQMDEADFKSKVIISMSRNVKVLSRLKKVERRKTLVINSAFGIEKCFRGNLTNSLINNDIPYPKSIIINTNQNLLFQNPKKFPKEGVWIKRGDFHAILKEDVSFAKTSDEALAILRSFYDRKIKEAVISENLKGDLVKFYGVADTNFFFWFYPYDFNHYKYQEFKVINGKTNYFPFDADRLEKIANKISDTINIPIYGGDAVVDSDGNIKVIDFNDWPSFAPCRDDAAKSIVNCIKKLYDERKSNLRIKKLKSGLISK